jgi:transposase
MSNGEKSPGVVGGVDTHKDSHAVVALDTRGLWLGFAQFPATPPGYRDLLAWLRRHGPLLRVGVEATGSYGAGLTRHLLAEGVWVLEVIPPRRRSRRGCDKSDPEDAASAARAALSGQATGSPKSADGRVEALRMIRLVRSSAIKARTQAANQLHALVETAPETLRERLRGHTVAALVHEAKRWRPSEIQDPYSACRSTLARLARRWHRLHDEIRGYDQDLERLTRQLCPQLLQRVGIGPEVASCLMVAAGDNPQRLKSEASFAALCGASPLDASSGRQRRHRLNRGGNRDANRALWVIAFVRLRMDPRTRAYAARRTAEGRTRSEITRCLKRYIAREVYALLMQSGALGEQVSSAA